MIDLKLLRENPDKYKIGAANKNCSVDIEQMLEIDKNLRVHQTELQNLTAEKKRIGVQIGQVAAQLKKAPADQQTNLQNTMKSLQQRPNEIKARETELSSIIAELDAQRYKLWLLIPQPADADVPVGKSEADNIQISKWDPDWFDTSKTFQQNRGFNPKSHIQLAKGLGLIDFERGVKIAGSRSYTLFGHGMRLHQAILRYAFDFMTINNGFTPISVPVIVRDEIMVGTGFFPGGKDQAYEIPESKRALDDGQNSDSGGRGGYDLYLTGTGEVGLMGLHKDEILDYQELPKCYTTLSTCFRREAGAAGKDTAGAYRVHQFDKVEQVVICKADENESRYWHKKMISFVETLLQNLQLPYRLLQCCTGDLGSKNADMIDIETWMPSRGNEDPQTGLPTGAYGETHSASRLYDYQCRRLNLRYRDPETDKPVICHSLNNTVAASPRLLIPIMEMYQNEDGTITVPDVLKPYMANCDVIK